MERLVAVLLVLVGTVSMSFACITKCKNPYCGREEPRTICSKDKYGRHNNNVYIKSCDSCPTCDHCGGKHSKFDCTDYNKGYNDGFRGNKNPCAPYGYDKSNGGYFKDKQESVEKTCNTGYKDGYDAYLRIKAKEQGLELD